VSKSKTTFRAFFQSPMLWGGAAGVGFYGLVSAGVLRGEYIDSYFTGHPVEYAATIMFFVGLAALGIKAVGITFQEQRLDEPLLGLPPEGGQPAADCRLLAARLDQLPPGRRSDYLVSRLRDALEHVRRSGSAEGLDEELRYLADMDAARLHASYGLVRVIIWAIPVLGFLGTVIGITLAIGKLSPDALETSLPEVMGSLSIAFYTTTQALGLSIVLMFAQFLTDRRENALLAEVDRRAEAEMVGRFARTGRQADGQLATVRQMIEAVVAGTEKLVHRQAELWQATVDAAARRWQGMAQSAGQQLETALAAALDQGLQRHAAAVAGHEERLSEANRRNWERVQETLVHNAQSLVQLNEAARQEAELLGRAIEAAGQVTSLEEALNDNLRALAGSKNFEETVMSLAAAIHLLNSRLGHSVEVPRVHLDANRKTGQAA
jgi:hypothetical protein